VSDPWKSVLDLAERLKHVDKCAASIHEDQPCIVRDVRYIGRELARIAQEQLGQDRKKDSP